jgi:MYXO-CTERM domain-containing protein
MRGTLLLIGILAILLGLIWIGQGTGYFPYPMESFMIDQTPWAYRGLGLAALGLIGIWASRRRSR